MKLKKISTIVLILLISSLLFNLNLTKVSALTLSRPYSWSSEKTIVSANGINFSEVTCFSKETSPECDTLVTILLADHLANKETFRFYIEKEDDLGYNYAIFVDLRDPSKGEIFEIADKWGAPSPDRDLWSIDIESTENGPQKLVGLGTKVGLWGKIKMFTRDGSGRPINEEIICGKTEDECKNGKGELQVALYTAGGFSANFDSGLSTTDTGVDDRAVIEYLEPKDEWYSWNKMTLETEMYANQIYSLRTKNAKDHFVDCFSGKDLPDTTGMQYCTLIYSGRVDFMFDEEGKIHIISNANEFEREAEVNGVQLKTYADGTKNLTQEDGINLAITEHLVSPLDKSLSIWISNIADLATTFLNMVMTQIDKLLNASEKFVLGVGVEGAWTNTRNIGISLLVFALIVIAFANTLQVDIEKYGLNRMIPRIIISIILAYSSWVIVKFFFDMANALQGQAIGLMGGANGLEVLKNLKITTPSTSDIVGKFGAIVTLIVILFLILICGTILWFSLVIRIIILSFLLAVAPLAFILNIMPFTENLYKKWWQEFFKWLFMAPIALAILGLGSVILSGTAGYNIDAQKFSADNVTDPDGMNLLIGLIIYAATMVMAARLPLEWGGKLMGSWRGVGKKIWGATGGAALGAAGKGAWNATGARIQNRVGGIFRGRNDLRVQKDQRWAADRRAEIAESGAGRFFVTGGDKTDARNMADAAIATHQARFMRDMDRDPAKAAAAVLKMKDGYQKTAALRALADAGKLDLLGAQKVGGEFGGVSFLDPKTGGWADKEQVLQEHFGGTKSAAYDSWVAWQAHNKALGNNESLDMVADAAIEDRKLQESLLDKNVGVAMTGQGANPDTAAYRMYRGERSKQLGKEGKAMHHDFIAEASVEDLQSLSERTINEIASKGTTKARNALKDRYKGGHLTPAQAAAYEKGIKV